MRTRKKKILFIVTALNVGGIETYLLRFLSFSINKIDATILCKSGKTGILEKDYKNLGIKVISSKLGYMSIRDHIKFYIYLKEDNFDTICDFTGDFAGFPLMTGKLAGIQTRLSFYRGSQHRFTQDVFRVFYNKLSNSLVSMCATKILSNSFTALDSFHPDWKESQSKFEVIRNGVPAELFEIEVDRTKVRKELGIPNDAFVIGHVGRFDVSKNHKTILNVAQHLCLKYKNVYFLLCGQGVSEGLKSLKKLDEQINTRIITPGMRSDIPVLLNIMDAYYFPSVTEGQPNALIEAMIIGLPFVASNILPIKEVVPPKYLNYLVDADDVNYSVELLESLIKNEGNFDSSYLSEWTKSTYDSKKLFNQFLMCTLT